MANIENGQSQRGWSFSLDAPGHYAIYEQVLRASGRDADSPLCITAQFAKERPPEENTAFVSREFGGLFRGYLFSQKQLAVGSLPEGLRIAWGDTVETPQAALIPWPDVAETLRGMLLRGEYMPQEALDRAHDNEIREAARDFLFMHREIDNGMVLVENDEIFEGGFPESTEKVMALLKDPAAHAELVTNLERLATAYAQNRDALRSAWHKPRDVLRKIVDVQAPHASFEAAPGFAYQPPPMFISQDEVDKVLRDDHIADQRFATFQYFTREHTPKEQADFLKEHYGTGGRYDNVMDQWHDSKGIKLSHGRISEPDTVLMLTWPKVAKRVAQLIAADRFLSAEDKEKAPQFLEEQERMAARLEQRQLIIRMAPLPPAEKRDTLTQRLAGYLNGMTPYEKEELRVGGFETNGEITAAQVGELLQSPLQTQFLLDGFASFEGKPIDFFTQNHARHFSAELRELYPTTYDCLPGDTVYIGGDKYEVLSIDDAEARLTDPDMPLVPAAFSRDEFSRGLAESNLNDRYLRIDMDAPARPLPEGVVPAVPVAAPATAPDVPMAYRYGMGSEVHLDDGDYVVFTASDSEVHLYNPRFPILMRNMRPDEFEQMLAENPANDYLLEPVEETPEEPAPEAEPALSPETPRILYKKYLPILLEEIRKGELYPYLRERDTDANDAEMSVGSELDSLADSFREDDPAFFEAYDSLPHFREWLAYDIFDRTYQDVSLDNRDSLARNESKSGCPEWAQRPSLPEQVREELYLRGFVVSEELIADGIEDTGAQDGHGDFLAIADHIEREYLTEDEPKPVLEEADTPERTERDAFNEYAVMFVRQVYDDEPYRNARANSDEQNAHDECYAAVDRIMQSIGVDNLEMYKLYHDTPGFRERMQAYVFKRTYTDTQREIARILRPTRPRKTAAQRNYEFLNRLAPEILSGEATYLRFTAGEGFMPLSMDLLGDNRIAISHYYEQNGDMMADSDMEFVFDREAGTLVARTYQQDNLGAFQRVEDDGGYVDTALERQLNSFVRGWFRNIRNQGYRRDVMLLRYADDALELVYGEDGQVRDINGEVSLIEAYTREHGIVLPAEAQREPTEPQTTETVPDPSLTFADRDQYGYTDDDMYPLSAERAIELYDTGHPIYLLYPDNTEALAEDRDEIITFRGDGLCGITHADWEMSPVYIRQQAIAQHQDTTVTPAPEAADDFDPASMLRQEIMYEGRRFRVDSVNSYNGKISLLDLAMVESGYPIFREVPVETARWLIEHKDDPPAPDRTLGPTVPAPAPERHNFRITDDALGHGGPKAKYRANIEAIALLKTLDAENRLASPAEQEILSRYVGWGAMPQAFDPENQQWAGEYQELQTLLTPEEYEAARASTLNAHYTSPTVIKAIYKAVENLGFTQGNVLEPSCGIGNFFGLVPESMAASKLYGVELDPITGRIARQLYQTASIAVQGFEATELPDSFFDLSVGNVPFGEYSVFDRRYDKLKFHIHDYFFAKALDKVRPGGVVAFITSKYTMDKQNPTVRKYIAQQAELLGAIRLPNTAFKANAGTEVTADIIFLQKRDRAIEVEPEWVHLGQTGDGITVNSYFIEHPEMMLGEMVMESTQYGHDSTCRPYPDRELADLLDEAVQNIRGEIPEYERDQQEEGSIPADPDVRNFSYTIYKRKVYYRDNSIMVPQELSATAYSRVKGMIGIRDSTRRLIELQTEDAPDSAIKREQARLGVLYDTYTAKYGLLSDRANAAVFRDDGSYPLLCSLEVIDKDGKLARKADMFTKRTIRPHVPITHVDTASEALTVSLAEKARVDIAFMSQLSGMSEDALIKELEGVIFYDFSNPDPSLPPYAPETMRLHEKFPLVTADEYLSGNVREKLNRMREFHDVVGTPFQGVDLSVNVRALEDAQPKDLTASEISVRLGATWVPTDVVQEFMYQLLDTPWRLRYKIQVHYSQYTAEWSVTGKGEDRNGIAARVTYGTDRVNAYYIIEQTLNLRTVRVFDTVYEVVDGQEKEKRVLNPKETAIAQGKQELIKAKFLDWIWDHPNRRDRLCGIYNSLYNSTRPREYDGSHINFVGMNPEIRLDAHQVNAVARKLFGGNALFGHVVGAGKTYTMVAAAMESKRLGLSSKALFVVPNNIVGQFSAEFLQLYPSANVLMVTAKDFEKQNRRKFCARIATGDYDGIVMAHSQFEKIPMSVEWQEEFLQSQIRDISEGIAEMRDQNGERTTIKQMERMRNALRVKIQKLNDQGRKDDMLTFEELGIDFLCVDEADLFKNLMLVTKMRNVAGIGQSDAQKASDLFMKTRYLDGLTGGRAVIFATGTPVSNTMAEMYVRP